jgi:hypothetical protein
MTSDRSSLLPTASYAVNVAVSTAIDVYLSVLL